MSVIDEKLPHKKPVRFIKEVIEEGDKHSISLVEFNEKPTLSAVVEAAAQNVIFIISLYKDFDGGVLTGMKNVKLLAEFDSGIYSVESTLMARIDNYTNFRFRLHREAKIFVEGEINIVMNKRKNEATNKKTL